MYLLEFKSVMPMQTFTRPITYQEFREMDFEEQELNEFIFELIDGQLVARNFPTASHQRILAELHLLIGGHVKINLTQATLTPNASKYRNVGTLNRWLPK
ncbi:hypothetical protein GCM10027190_55990 [Spirosoma areae]